MSTYFLLDPFEFHYCFYRIRGELIYVLSIVACIPSTFCPNLGHHLGSIYYKSDVTFVLAYYHYDFVKRQKTLCKNNINTLNLESSTVKTLLHSGNMLKQKLHHFCNRSSPDDGPKSGRKY